MDEPWEANATKLFGIPLHPLGEIAFLSYINMRSSRGETPNVEVQNRIMGLHIQLALATMLGTLFAYNLIRLFRHIKAQSYKLSDLCYFLPSFLGIVNTILFIVASLTNQLNCRILIWCIMASIGFSVFFNSIVILYKAYLVLLSQRWVAICGTICILPQFFFFFIAYGWSYVTLDEHSGCTFNHQHIVVWYWIGMMIPSNILFSGIFSAVTYKHYKKYGSDAWKRLAHDGIQTMCLVVFCNILCCSFIIFKMGGPLSTNFYIIDWYITSTILVNYGTKKHTSSDSSTLTVNRQNNIYSSGVNINTTRTGYSSRVATITNYISLLTLI